MKSFVRFFGTAAQFITPGRDWQDAGFEYPTFIIRYDSLHFPTIDALQQDGWEVNVAVGKDGLLYYLLQRSR